MRTPPSRERAGRGAAWLLLVVVLLGALAWALSGGRGASKRSGPPRPDPAAEPTPPEAPETPTTRPPAELAQPASAQPASAEPRTEPPGAEASAPAKRLGLLVVNVWTPEGGFAGPLNVRVRRATGELVAQEELGTDELARADPARTEFACASGEYEVEVEQLGPPHLAAQPVRAGLAADAQKAVTLWLVPTHSVTGVLLDAHDAGVADVRIALHAEARTVVETRTRFDGVFVLAPAPEGSYELVVGDPLGPLLPRRNLSLAAELERLELHLPPLLELDVRVVDENQLEVPGAKVEGVGESAGRVAGETDATGRLHIEGLPPGNYRLFASHPTRGRGNEIFVLSSALAQPIVIQLRTGRPVK